LNDGVVGYWVEQQNGEYVQFIAPQSNWTSNVADREARENLALYHTGGVAYHAYQSLSAPLLTDPHRAQIPLPLEPGYAWSWVQHDQTHWTEITATPLVRRTALLKAFPANGAAIWDELLAKNWLSYTGDPERAAINAKNKQQPLVTFATRADDIQRVLHLAEEVLQPPPEEARFGPTQEIREGWLQLTPE
jgi:hypothetical protein